MQDFEKLCLKNIFLNQSYPGVSEVQNCERFQKVYIKINQSPPSPAPRHVTDFQGNSLQKSFFTCLILRLHGHFQDRGWTAWSAIGSLMALAGWSLSANPERVFKRVSDFPLCIPRSEAFWVSGWEQHLWPLWDLLGLWFHGRKLGWSPKPVVEIEVLVSCRQPAMGLRV